MQRRMCSPALEAFVQPCGHTNQHQARTISRNCLQLFFFIFNSSTIKMFSYHTSVAPKKLTEQGLGLGVSVGYVWHQRHSSLGCRYATTCCASTLCNWSRTDTMVARHPLCCLLLAAAAAQAAGTSNMGSNCGSDVGTRRGLCAVQTGMAFKVCVEYSHLVMLCWFGLT